MEETRIPAKQESIYKENSIAELPVVRASGFGAFLDGGTGNSKDDILLHKGQQTHEVKEGERVKVFLYHDPHHRLTASMRLPQIAIAGKSNVGKSSVINKLLNRKNFARVSAQPGKTIHINYFTIDKAMYLVDLPGYGYAQRGKKMMEKIQKLIEYYVLEREQMTCLFVLIDSRLEPQRIDMEFIEWLGENGIPFALIFTKADKQSVGKTKASVNRFLDTLKEQWEELPPHFISSSENKTGRQEILDYIEQVNRSLKEQAE